MWFSYLLSNSQSNCCQAKLNSRKCHHFLNYQLIENCLKKEILSNNIRKALSPLLIVQNQKIKIQAVEDLNQVKIFACQGTNLQDVQKQDNISSVVSCKKKMIKKERLKKTKKQSIPQSQKGRNPGRNSTSNIFRVFLKLCCKSTFQKLLREKISQISNAYNTSFDFEKFKMKIKQLAPSTSNYINVKQFKKIWSHDCQFSKVFRSLFHWFLNNFGVNHSLTLKGKHKMMKESITHFLNNLRNIEKDLDEKDEEQEQMQE